MKLGRRVLSALLCLMMLVNIWSPCIPAGAAGDFRIVGSTTQSAAGSEAKVTLSLENNPGIMAINLYYIYNEEYLTLTKVENAVSDFTMTHGTTTVWDAGGNYTKDGVLATLTFQVAKDAPQEALTVEIGFLSAANQDFQAVTAVTQAAVIDLRCDHSFGPWTYVDASVHKQVCAKCGAEVTASHTEDEGTVTTEPNCTDKGEETFACTECKGVLRTVVLDELGHKISYAVTKAPTAQASGVLTGTCSVCQDTTEITLPALDEVSYTRRVTVEAECETVGSAVYTWTETQYGSYEFTVELPALGHDFVDDICTRCGAEKICEHEEKTEVPAKGADCLQPGNYQYFVCDHCGLLFDAEGQETTEEAVVIPALGHAPAVDAAVAPTCTEDGLTEGSHCSRCGEILTAQEIVPALGHSFENGQCTVCGKLTPDAVTLAEFAPELVGGKTLTFKASFVPGVTVKDKTFLWSIRETDKAFASISTAGKLTTKTVMEPVTVEVTATAKTDPDAFVTGKLTLLPLAAQAVITNEPGADGVIFQDLNDGKEVQLNAMIFPKEASQAGTWKSSSDTIAKVSADGLVTFKKAGAVTITFTAADGSKKADTVKVRAAYPVTGITITGSGKELAFEPDEAGIEHSDIELLSGDKLTLKAAANTDASVKTLAWSVSDAKAASVTTAGAVTAKTVYETKHVVITVRATDGSGVERKIEITVNPKDNVLPVWDADETVVNGTTIYADKLDGSLTLTAPEGTTWTTSSAAVATVEDGVVTFMKNGTATITAKNGVASGKVTVKIARLVEGLDIAAKSSTVLTSGKGKVTLTAKPTNTDATTKTVTWASSNTAVATVSTSGVVTAKAGVLEPTIVTITATAKDGSGKTVSMDVEVIPVATAVSVLAAQAFTAQNGTEIAEEEVLNGRTIKVDIERVQSLSLKTAVYPMDANDDVTWKSSSTKIAKVDADGNVTIVGLGTVTITATSADGSKKLNTVKLTVVRYAKSLADNTASHTVTAGKKLTLKVGLVTDSGVKASSTGLTYKCSNTAWATVSTSGVITSKKAGKGHTVEITVTYKDDPSVFLVIPVNIT